MMSLPIQEVLMMFTLKRKNKKMHFNKILYSDNFSIITYDACKYIWDNRGYLLKREQTADNKRKNYRKIYSDTAVTKLDTGPYGPCLAITHMGWSNSSRLHTNSPILLWVYPDKVVVNNIAKKYYGTKESAQKHYTHYGFQRMLMRMTELCGQSYIERKTRAEKILDKNGKCVNDVFYTFKSPTSIAFTNKHDSPNYISMTITSDIQAKMMATGNPYHSYGKRRHTAFLLSGTECNSVAHSRTSITSLGLLREYTLNYVSSLLQNEDNKQNLVDFAKYSQSPYLKNNTDRAGYIPKDIDEHMRYFGNIGYGVPTDKHVVEDEQRRTVGVRQLEKNNQVRSSDVDSRQAWLTRNSHDELPVALTYLYPQIITKKVGGSNTFNEYMTQDCISDTMGFGLSEALKDKPSNTSYWSGSSIPDNFSSPLARVNFTKIRALSGSRSLGNSCNMVPGTASEIHTAPYSGLRHSTSPGLGGYDESTHEQLKGFTSHMIQTCLSSNSVMYRKAMSGLHLPLGILINAVLVEASNYPDHYDFILGQYFGTEALDVLKKSSSINFQHPIHSSFMMEGHSTKKGRNMLEDTIKLMSGTGVLHYLINENNACTSFAIEAACGFRVLLDHGAYADGIPIYVCNSGNPILDKYEEDYHLALYNFQKTFLSDEFVDYLDAHLKNSFSWTREGKLWNKTTHSVSYVDAFSDKCKSSISKYSQVIYNYLKNAIFKANSSGGLIDHDLSRGFKHIGRVTGQPIKHYDISLRSNLKVNPIRSIHKDVKFIEELETSLS